MRDDRVTLKLEGTVPLDLFATAMSAFSALIKALTADVATGAKVDWIVEELSGGTAFASFAGESEDLTAVRNVVQAYTAVGSALQKHEPIPYSESVRREANRIIGIVNGKVSGIAMQNIAIESDAAVVEPDAGQHKSTVTLGAVEGVIQTVSSRNALRFTLYDALNDKAVYCYLSPTQHDMMRDYWDKRAIVQGLVARHPVTGRPIEIRHISKVQLVETSSDYRRARGILSEYVTTDELPEVTVRRSRDAE